jgi:hypothetical protein
MHINLNWIHTLMDLWEFSSIRLKYFLRWVWYRCKAHMVPTGLWSCAVAHFVLLLHHHCPRLFEYISVALQRGCLDCCNGLFKYTRPLCTHTWCDLFVVDSYPTGFWTKICTCTGKLFKSVLAGHVRKLFLLTVFLSDVGYLIVG